MNEHITNKMASVSVKKLMLSMGIPMVISLMLQALYNIVHSLFIANIQENAEAALNALTLAFPLQILMVATAIGTGVGANALLSRSLGQGDRDKASLTAGNAVFLGILISVIFAIFGVFGTELYAESQTSDPLVCSMASDYLRICCIFSFGNVLFAIFEKLLQAGAHPICSTISLISGAAANIILDPIMIYGLWGCDEMGIKGAAWATVIGQIVSFAVACLLHLCFNSELSKNIKNMKPSFRIISEIYKIGVPAIISQALISVMTYGLNIILGALSDVMVTVYGLFYKIQQFVLFAAFGFRDAITPIVSFNYGKKDSARVEEGIRCGLLYTILLMAIGTTAAEMFANPISTLFSLSGEANSLFTGAVRIISVSFVFAGANIAFQGVFQALNRGAESLVISFLRQLVLIFPIVILFVSISKVNPEMKWIVWTAFPITELLSLSVTVLMFRRVQRKIR